MKLSIALSLLVLAAPGLAAQAQPRTQTAAEHVTLGDRDHAAMNSVNALRHYEAALSVDSMYFDALVKAASEAIVQGQNAPVEADRTALYKRAEQYARRAVAARPNDAEGHFELAKSIGKNALTMGTSDRVKYAGVVHDEAMAALKINPKHPGALHIMGVWNAEIMRLSGLKRFMAKNVLGGKTFGEANWDNAISYLEQAKAIEPNRITHRVDLAEVYIDRKMTAKAREELDWVAKAPLTEFDDKRLKDVAAKLLSDLK